MKIVFLQNSATQPRCHKRFRTFRDIGVNGKVYSFHRNWYNVNLPEDIEIISLGNLVPGSYFSRLRLYIKKLKTVFLQNKGVVFYCYGLDMAFVAMLFRQKYIYEESDIMYVDYRSAFMRGIMKRLDLFVQKKSLATVLTSQGFIGFLYKKCPLKTFVLPNKLDPYFKDKSRPDIKKTDPNSLKIAFIGLLRHEENIFSFVEVMETKAPKFEFHIWGDSTEATKRRIKDFCDRHSNVFYHGPFRNPVDLDYIYSQVDMNFVCYDANGINERIAEPNKLYESSFFNTPLIVSPGTYLSKVVGELGIGYALDCTNKDAIDVFFSKINEGKLREMSENCAKIKTDDLIDNHNAYLEIVDIISKNIRS